MHPSTIGGINKLDEGEKRAIYARYIPKDLVQRFNLLREKSGSQFDPRLVEAFVSEITPEHIK